MSLTPIICARCTKETTVPFKPTRGAPVFCDECYGINRTERMAHLQGKINNESDPRRRRNLEGKLWKVQHRKEIRARRKQTRVEAAIKRKAEAAVTPCH